MNWLDRAIAGLSPTWALSRARRRLRARYAVESLRAVDILSPSNYQHRYGRTAHDAANRQRTSNDWPVDMYSADGALLPEARTIVARARSSKRNSWAVRSIVDAYRRHVVGSGITCRSSARDPLTGESLEEFNRDVDRKFWKWASNPKRCDIEGRKTLIEMQGLTIEEWATTGESFAVLHLNADRELCIQILEPEQCADDQLIDYNGPNQIRGGVEINEFGRPVAYWFYDREHPLEQGRGKPVRVPANRVMHFFRQERPRQTRGLTRLASILKKMRHLDMYDEYTLVRARMEACFGIGITSDNPLQDGDPFGLKVDAGNDGQDTRYNDEFAFEPGMVFRGQPGEELTFFDPKAPGNTYDPFKRSQIQDIAAGAGLDYPTVARDYSKANFASQREAHLERDRETDPIQRMLIDIWLAPIREAWITNEVLRGGIRAPEFFGLPDYDDFYFAADYQPPPKPWIDPSKQAAATKMALEMRLTTLKREANTLGVDSRDLIREAAEEKAFAAEQNVTLPFHEEQPKTAPQEPRPDREEDPEAQAQEQEPVL